MHKRTGGGREGVNPALVCIGLGVVRSADQMRGIGKGELERQLLCSEQRTGNGEPQLVLMGVAKGGDLHPLRVEGEGTADHALIEVELLGNGRKIPSCDALGGMQADVCQVEPMGIDPQVIEQ